MITEVRVRNDIGQVLNLPFDAFSENSDYIVREIEGLGPVNAEISTSPYAILAGSQLLSSRGGERSIDISLGFSPYTTQSAQKLRTELYTFLMTGTPVTLELYSDDHRPVYITGIIETNEPTIFTPDPGVRVVVLCPKPDFLDLEEVVLSGYTEETIEIDYPGTAATGFRAEVYVTETTPSIAIRMSGLVESNFTVTDPKVETFPEETPPEDIPGLLGANAIFRSGDRLIAQTQPGEKGAWRVRANTQSSVIAYKTNDSTWLALRRGTSIIDIVTGTPNSTYVLTYRPRYGGL